MSNVRSTGALAAAIILCATAPVWAAEPSPATGQTTAIAGPAVTTAPSPTGGAAAVERLTLDQCIELTLKRNPSLTAAESAMNAAGSRVGQAQSAYYPQVNLAGNYSKFSPYTDPANATQDLYQGTATVTQNIFDFGKTPSQVRIQRFGHEASREDRRTVYGQVVFNVKQAYYTLLQAGKNLDVTVETLKLNQEQLDQARGFFDAGVKSKYDVTTAEVNLSNARLARIRAENAVRIARVTLKNVMGSPDLPDFSIVDTLAFQKYPVTFDDAIQRAYANRPDLRSTLAKKEASKESISLARSGYYPTLSGNASITRADSDFPPEKSGWSAGVTLTVPLFSGFLTNNQVKEAKENLNVQKANEETLRQGILLDVQQAYLNLLALEDGVAVAELTVQQAKDNFDIATGRYNAGVGSPLDVTSALVGLSNAKTNFIAALVNYKIAEAALLKAMGE
jgi:TolC family type I secretion outer membrane protein